MSTNLNDQDEAGRGAAPAMPQIGRPGRLRRLADGFFSYLSLFTSLGTLVCCALPTELVMVGLGASAAGLFAAAPWLVALSSHKIWVFIFAGVMIAGNFVYVYAIAPRLKATGEACEVGAGPSACDTATRVGKWALWLSAAVYLVGFFVAFLLLPLSGLLGIPLAL